MRLAYQMIYSTLIANVREDARSEVDALLGIPGAQEAYDEERRAMVAAAGLAIG